MYVSSPSLMMQGDFWSSIYISTSSSFIVLSTSRKNLGLNAIRSSLPSSFIGSSS